MSAAVKCPTGKRGFPSAKSAKKANANVPNKIRPYLCPECHHWHITSNLNGECR